MDKFIIGFALGLALGAAAVILLAPSPETEARARLRVRTERFASGEETPVGAVKGFADSQRSKLEDAIEAGRRASAQRQRELWAELNLPPPDDAATA